MKRNKNLAAAAVLSVLLVSPFAPAEAKRATPPVTTQEMVNSQDDSLVETSILVKVILTESSGVRILSFDPSEKTLKQALRDQNLKPVDWKGEDGKKISDETLSVDDELYLFKVESFESFEAITIPYTVETIETTQLPIGESNTIVSGQAGKALKTTVRTVDLSQKKTVNSKAKKNSGSSIEDFLTVVKIPVTQKVLVGVGSDEAAPTLGCSNGSTIPDTVDPNIQKVHMDLCRLFPEVTVYGTYRDSCTYTCDHRDGIAVDIMVSEERGWEIAYYLEQNYEAYDVNNIIYERHIWSPGDSAWDLMDDRGSETQNHMDHVHLSVLPSTPLETALLGL